MSDGVRPWADQRHFAAQHIEQLRQLIQAELAQGRAQSGDAVVVSGGLANRLAILGDGHGAELEDRENLAVQAGSALVEQSRPATFQFDQHGDGQQQRQEKQQRAERHQNVKGPFAPADGHTVDHRRRGDQRRGSASRRPALHLGVRAKWGQIIQNTVSDRFE